VTKGQCKSREFFFFLDKETKITNWEHDFFKQYRTLSAVKRVEFIGDRMSCTILICCLCNIIVVPTHQLIKLMIQDTVFLWGIKAGFRSFS